MVVVEVEVEEVEGLEGERKVVVVGWRVIIFKVLFSEHQLPP